MGQADYLHFTNKVTEVKQYSKGHKIQRDKLCLSPQVCSIIWLNIFNDFFSNIYVELLLFNPKEGLYEVRGKDFSLPPPLSLHSYFPH